MPDGCVETTTWKTGAAAPGCCAWAAAAIWARVLGANDIATLPATITPPEATLTAAETGHLVFGTLHVTSAPESINRIVDVFPTGAQEQVRLQLAGVLEAVLSQTLVPRAHGDGRVCAMEILIGTVGVRNLIRENKPAQMMNAIQTGSSVGMISLDKSLASFVADGRITLEAAIEKSSHPDELRRMCAEAAPAQPKTRFASSF